MNTSHIYFAHHHLSIYKGDGGTETGVNVFARRPPFHLTGGL